MVSKQRQSWPDLRRQPVTPHLDGDVVGVVRRSWKRRFRWKRPLL